MFEFKAKDITLLTTEREESKIRYYVKKSVFYLILNIFVSVIQSTALTELMQSSRADVGHKVVVQKSKLVVQEEGHHLIWRSFKNVKQIITSSN